uniref:Transmembrane protein n=1 Tax=Ditylenchus dipsaci TaxID=166011 RepID=A0A915E3W5_9BILA
MESVATSSSTACANATNKTVLLSPRNMSYDSDSVSPTQASTSSTHSSANIDSRRKSEKSLTRSRQYGPAVTKSSCAAANHLNSPQETTNTSFASLQDSTGQFSSIPLSEMEKKPIEAELQIDLHTWKICPMPNSHALMAVLGVLLYSIAFLFCAQRHKLVLFIMTGLTSTAFQVKFCSGIDDFYCISGELLWRFWWTTATSHVNFCYVSASQVDFFSHLSGLIWHLRQNPKVFQVDFYGIFGGLLRQLKLPVTAYSSGLPRHLGQTSTITQVTFTASQVHFYGFPGGFKWTSSVIQVDFYNNSSRLLRHLQCTSTASQVDFYGFSGGINWTFTTIQVVLQILRWSSAALQVDFYGSSGGPLW